MTKDEAIEICNRWFAHNDRQRWKAERMLEAARLAKQGDRNGALRIRSEVDSSPVVFDGERLEEAVKCLLKEIM